MTDFNFSDFDSVSAAETLVPHQLKSPYDGAPLTYKGEPVNVLLRGLESQQVADVKKASRVADMTTTKEDAAESPLDFREVHKKLVKNALPLIGGFENMYNGDEPVGIEQAEAFLNQQIYGLFKPKMDENGEEMGEVFVVQIANAQRTRWEALGNA